jgi:hypothetical protein
MACYKDSFTFLLFTHPTGFVGHRVGQENVKEREIYFSAANRILSAKSLY